MARTKEELEKQWPKRLEKLETLYQWGYVSSHGPKGKGTPWSEIVAERLMATEQLDRFLKIQPIKSKHYNIQRHLDPRPSGEGSMPQSEKQVVKWMVGKGDLGVLGTAQNYEAPLVDTFLIWKTPRRNIPNASSLLAYCKGIPPLPRTRLGWKDFKPWPKK